MRLIILLNCIKDVGEEKCIQGAGGKTPRIETDW
jgi:hypothetical protein